MIVTERSAPAQAIYLRARYIADMNWVEHALNPQRAVSALRELIAEYERVTKEPADA